MQNTLQTLLTSGPAHTSQYGIFQFQNGLETPGGAAHCSETDLCASKRDVTITLPFIYTLCQHCPDKFPWIFFPLSFSLLFFFFTLLLFRACTLSPSGSVSFLTPAARRHSDKLPSSGVCLFNAGWQYAITLSCCE